MGMLEFKIITATLWVILVVLSYVVMLLFKYVHERKLELQIETIKAKNREREEVRIFVVEDLIVKLEKVQLIRPDIVLGNTKLRKAIDELSALIRNDYNI